MFEDLSGKKLLILGGMRMACDLVRQAQKMGVYVVVADYVEDCPAKKIADQGTMTSATDIEGIVKFCKEEKIDGITTGYADILMPICLEVCKRLNLPYYGTEEMINVSTDKAAFKRMCQKYDMPYPKTYKIDNENFEIEAEKLEYPVFVKPMDSSGSRGAAVCNNKIEFVKQYKLALTFSKSQNVIVEEYLTGTEFILDYLIIDGIPKLLSMFDRKVTKERPSAVNHANLLVAPSENIKVFQENIHPKVANACEKMGFKNGILFFQGYCKNNKITFFEMGCRLGGTFPDIDEHFLGINPMNVLIHHALTGKMIDSQYIDKIKPNFSGLGVVVNLLINKKQGEIYKLEGIEDIKKIPEVINCIQYLYEGDKFNLGNQTDCPVAILYIAANSSEKAKKVIEQIYDLISVKDKNGNNLLMPFYPVDQIEFERY